jgi:pimeloyl-ACP methyl ester carboxylesterase
LSLRPITPTRAPRISRRLRKVLGEDQLALFALSYGTRLALTYARDYPGRVEAMVLDSPLPHSAKYDDAYPANLEAALRRVAALCAADPRMRAGLS